MILLNHKNLQPTPPTGDEMELAREAGPRLRDLVKASTAVEVRVAGLEEPLLLPASSLRLLADILAQMGDGNAVTVLPVETELTTQQAADLLNVSRPYLVKLLDEGKLPHRTVGTRRRVLLCDVLAYKKAEVEARARVLEELAAQAQELDMGYDTP